MAVSCTDGEVVRSGDGPTPNPGDVTAVAADEAAPETTKDTKPPSTTSTTQAVQDAEPSTSAVLTTVGTTAVPDGESGSLSIVLTGPPQRGSVPVAVRNRTPDTIHSLEVSGTARTPAGDLVASGSSFSMAPARLGAGEWAFGFVYFGYDEFPGDVSFDLTASGQTQPGFMGQIDVRPVELNQIEGSYSRQVVGIVQNDSDDEVAGPISVSVACFDDSGTQLLSTHESFTDGNDLAPGGTSSFSIDLFDVTACANYVVGASGWSF
ncbi:MAG: FxLYD domain-containing protein [Acidimicrobiales bacterium]